MELRLIRQWLQRYGATGGADNTRQNVRRYVFSWEQPMPVALRELSHAGAKTLQLFGFGLALLMPSNPASYDFLRGHMWFNVLDWNGE